MVTPLKAKDKWTELNIGPFRVDTDGDISAARQALAQLEQSRWILSGMLENNDLTATWPFRVLVTDAAPAGGASFQFLRGQYVAAIRPGTDPPLAEAASLFFDFNTTRMPAEVEHGLPLLFEGLKSAGAKITWAVPVSKPDIDWARVHMFATKPEYQGRFHVFINNLRGGSLLTVAEANAFGKDSKTLEAEVRAYFGSGMAQAAVISGRPLDAKRDVGEHPFDSILANVYLADLQLKTNPSGAERAYKAAGNAGYTAEAQTGMAMLVVSERGDAREYLDSAIAAGTKDPWVYLKAAEDRPPNEANGLLKTARDLNPRWWVPVARMAELAEKPAEKEALLTEVCRKNPRSAELWEQLAVVQSNLGLGLKAQNSWMRAEDAAPTPQDRDQIHRRRQALENARLDAQERARTEAEETAKREDNRLRDAQEARIKAAAQRANEANAGGSHAADDTGAPPERWWNEGERPVEGTVTQVDCLGGQARMRLKGSDGKLLTLWIPDWEKLQSRTPIACGPQSSAQTASVVYKARVDKQHGTAGDVVQLQLK